MTPCVVIALLGEASLSERARSKALFASRLAARLPVRALDAFSAQIRIAESANLERAAVLIAAFGLPSESAADIVTPPPRA